MSFWLGHGAIAARLARGSRTICRLTGGLRQTPKERSSSQIAHRRSAEPRRVSRIAAQDGEAACSMQSNGRVEHAKHDAFSYADAVAKSMQLLLNALERRFEDMAQTEKVDVPQELGHSTDQLKILLSTVQSQLLRLNAPGDAESQEDSEDKDQPSEELEEDPEIVREQDVVPELVGKPVSADNKGKKATLCTGRQARDDDDGGAECVPLSLACSGAFGLAATRTFKFKKDGASGRPRSARSPWSEHFDPASGKPYYYNRATKVSSWTKPEEDESSHSVAPEEMVVEPVSRSSSKMNRQASARSLQGVLQTQRSLATLGKKPDAHGHHRKSCLIDPRWGAKLLWDFFVMFVVLFDALILPFQLAFKNNSHDSFDEFWFWWTTVLFSADIVLSFNTAIQVDDDGSRPDALLRDRKAIAIAYVKGWFSIDFFSTVPWPRLASVFAAGQSDGGSTQAAKLLKVVKFLRLMRLMRM
ncbi:unnamed protein product, partial [Effrenium voratum]